eukprot:g2532.t1
MENRRILAALAVIATLASAADPPVARKEITSLPGWPGPPPMKMYSGYVDAGTPPSGKGSMYFHYIAALSEGDPAKDPVLIWYNGGPGASSLFGLLQELGPLLFNVRSFDESYNRTGIPSAVRNPFAWTKHGTVIAIDSPPPIGFSYCTEYGPTGGGTSCGPWTDKSVFAANHAAHRTLFTKVFPEFLGSTDGAKKGNPVFFTGESYGGIYIPGFVDAMMDDPVPGLNLAGFAVGDGWTGCVPQEGKQTNYCVDLDNVGLFNYPNVAQGPWYDIEFFHGHSQFSEELYRRIRAACTEDELRSADAWQSKCGHLIDEMREEVGGYYAYDLYNDCPTNDRRRLGEGLGGVRRADKHGIFRALRARREMQRRVARAAIGFNGQADTEPPLDPGYGPGAHQAGGGAPCPSTAMDKWLALNASMEALGVPLDSNFLNLDNGHGFDYTPDQPQVTYIYKKALEKGLRVLIYEGDSDACGLQTAPVEEIFTNYFNSINLTKTRKWRPWTTDGEQRVGGYVIEWINRQVQFVSIRGSGHLVPENKPDISSHMLGRFLNNQPFLNYTAPSHARRFH